MVTIANIPLDALHLHSSFVFFFIVSVFSIILIYLTCLSTTKRWDALDLVLSALSHLSEK